MLSSPSWTIVFRMCKSGLHPLYVNVEYYHTRSSRGASERRTFVTVHTKGEHIIILILSVRDHLIMLPSRSNLSKIRCIKRINITCMDNVIWYSPSCTWSPSLVRHGMISIIPPAWRQGPWRLHMVVLHYIELLHLLTHSDKVKQLHGVNWHAGHKIIKTTIWLLPVAVLITWSHDHLIHQHIYKITSWPYHITCPAKTS